MCRMISMRDIRYAAADALDCELHALADDIAPADYSADDESAELIIDELIRELSADNCAATVKGFVRFAESLHRGAQPSVKLLG